MSISSACDGQVIVLPSILNVKQEIHITSLETTSFSGKFHY